jgi:hypothetical protein
MSPASVVRGAWHWIFENACATLGFGTLPSKPWNAGPPQADDFGMFQRVPNEGLPDWWLSQSEQESIRLRELAKELPKIRHISKCRLTRPQSTRKIG